jgi:acyl carrier protein
MDVQAVIRDQMQQVADQQNKTLKPLTSDSILLDCGLDSLCFAILVTRLEDEFGFDPFATADEVQFPVTFGDFVQFYERAHAAA